MRLKAGQAGFVQPLQGWVPGILCVRLGRIGGGDIRAIMNSRSDYLGVEFNWFAVDPDGFIAMLSSAGYGPIPDGVFERFDGQEGIEEFLRRLIGPRMDDDLRRAERLLASVGVFAYDWKHWEGPYQRSAVPKEPKRLAELGIPEALRGAFLAYPERFSASEELRPETCLTCTR